MAFDVETVRQDFPALAQSVNNHPLVYLDAAVHRGVHTLSANATTRVENVRQKAADFLHATSPEEIVFVKGTTEGINLVANSFGREFIQQGDNIIITEMEHHANIVPWFMLAEERGFEVRILPIVEDGTLDTAQLTQLIDARTKLFSFTHISNVLGTVNPVKALISHAREIASQYGNPLAIVVDGAQGAMHQTVDVQALDCDFYVCSGHKLYGPTGIGILYGKKAWLEKMPPWEGGGAMIRQVSLTKGITFADIPWRFEAGTPNISGIVGLGAALDYLNGLGLSDVFEYEKQLMQYATELLKQVPSLRLYGNDQREGVIAFNLGEHHAYDVGAFLDRYGIAIRTGHHCAMPLMELSGSSYVSSVYRHLYDKARD